MSDRLSELWRFVKRGQSLTLPILIYYLKALMILNCGVVIVVFVILVDWESVASQAHGVRDFLEVVGFVIYVPTVLAIYWRTIKETK